MNERDYELLKRFKQYQTNDKIISPVFLRKEILSIYDKYRITHNMSVKEQASQSGRQKAYLSALKKRMKREIVKELVYDIVKYYKIEKTTFHFVYHICAEFLGRNIDNRFILEHFSNMIADENYKLKKINSKRNASDKMKLDCSYSDLVLMKNVDENYEGYFSTFNFMTAFNDMLENINMIFEGNRLYSQIENHKELDALIEKYEIRKMISNNIEFERENDIKTEPPKRNRL